MIRRSTLHHHPMISSLEAQLNTNYVPTDKEVTILKKGLEKSEQRLDGLDAEIRQLRDRLGDLSSKEEQLSKRVERYKGMLAPARRLLPEILQEIFYHALPAAHNSIMSSKEPPLVLGRVCSQWRRVAFATPRLWASIHIVIPQVNPFKPDTPCDDLTLISAIASWLSRSGVLPLSISLSSPLWPSDPTIPTNCKMMPYLDTLSRHAARWKSIHFRIQNFDWAEFFDRYNAADLLLLEDIHLEGIQVSRDPSEELVLPDFSSAVRENNIFRAPGLRSLSMPRYDRQILQLPVRWGNLTDLKLFSNTYALRDITQGLLLCPNLESCSISLSDWNGSEDGWIDPTKVTLPRLRALSITDDMTQHDVSCLLEHLYTPELLHLVYNRRGTVYWGELDTSFKKKLIDPLASFLRRAVHPLEELELGAESLTDVHVVGILELVPGLKRFSLRSFGGSEMPSFRRPRRSLWAPPPTFCFSDGPLKRLTPSGTGDDLPVEAVSICNGVEARLGGEVNNDRELSPIYEEISEWSLDSSVIAHDPWKIVSNKCLCPNLEVFHCTGALFSDLALLDFLRSRSLDHGQFGVAHLRRVGIQFAIGRTRSNDTIREIEALEKETGMVVCLTYFPRLVNPAPLAASVYSPYEGLECATQKEYMPQGYFGFQPFR